MCQTRLISVVHGRPHFIVWRRPSSSFGRNYLGAHYTRPTSVTKSNKV